MTFPSSARVVIVGGGIAGASVGQGYLTHSAPITANWIQAGTYQIEIAGTMFDAEVSLRPFYDPTNIRIKS